MSHSNANNAGEGSENMGEEDATLLEFRDRYARTEVRLMALLGRDAENASAHASSSNGQPIVDVVAAVEDSQPASAPKKAARAIDEDDYGDDDDDEEEEDVAQQSPLKGKGGAVPVAINGITSTALQIPPMARKPSIERQASASSTDKNKTAEDVRKELEQDKRAREDAARESFQTLLYTLESDRDAMLEQQKLEELDRQVEKEMAGQNNGSVNQPSTTAAPLGTLSSTNLGASSLTLKHLIARIDAKRNEVHASDQHLRSLMSEVRKNRSKWASEDMVGQEELYEAAEKVLFELKAMTEYAGPFLVRVQKREAPDYYNIIKHPMDIGTMLKKLKGYQYKSKKDFVDDLNLIWANCLKYNTDPNHPIRKKALYMRKETEKLVPLIPDIVVKTRAEVEAEERRQQNADADGEAVEDSDDEEPIMASRGRKAPSKSNKGTNNARKAPPALAEGTPGAETKPTVPHLKDSASNLRTEFLRADSDAPMDGSQNGLTTPPPGTLTPLGPHGIFSSGAPGSQVDPSEADAGASASGAVVAYEDADIDDLEYKTWKQVTKKDRALMASERNRLFRGDKLNVDEPAILRSRAGMRRWIRQQKVEDTALDGMETQSDGKAGVQTSTETLAEGIQGEDERQLPDYYDPVSAIPNLHERLRWVEDAEGQVIFQSEEFLRIKPKAQFVAPSSSLTKKMDANMKQMQETRKVCAKIGVVKQMQLQAQMYQNQFQKYEPTPLQETDVGDVVTSDDGPIMSQWTCRAALQRSVGKIFYHAGFEDFQPAALDTVTDIAGQYFHNLVRTLQSYRETPKIQSANLDSSWHLRFTAEESILHGLLENGIDVESLESYVKDDMDRMGSKLGIMQERMKAHLAELLVSKKLFYSCKAPNHALAACPRSKCRGRWCRCFQRWQRAVCWWRFRRGDWRGLLRL